MAYNPMRRRLMAGLLLLGAGTPLAARTQTPTCETAQDLGGVFLTGSYLEGDSGAAGLFEIPISTSGVTLTNLRVVKDVFNPLRYGVGMNGSAKGGVFAPTGVAFRYPRLESSQGYFNPTTATIRINGKPTVSGSFSSMAGGGQVALLLSELPEAERPKLFETILKGATIDLDIGGDPLRAESRLKISYKTPDVRGKLKPAGAALGKLYTDGKSGACAPLVSDCFLTTASVDTVGLADDCWELTTLRAFRDGPLTQSADGRALVADYYDRAPRLVEAVNARADAARVWLATYWTGVVPSAVAARLGLNRAALFLYRRMIERLEAKA